MATADTISRILDAAELLFAEQGYTETTLRQITSRAGVNLASVNYHFGSKKSLSQAVVDRYLAQFMPLLDSRLQALLQEPQPLEVEQVFEAFIEPLVALELDRQGGSLIFMQLIGRGFSENQGHLRRFIFTHYGQVLDHLQQGIVRACPQLSPVERFWRLHFTLGSLVFLLTSGGALQEIALADFGEESDIQGMLGHLIPFLAAGFRAPGQAVAVPRSLKTANA